MNKGWICPRCGKINSPYINQCTCTANEFVSSNMRKCNHQWECCGVSTAGSTYRCKICGETKTEYYNADKSNITISSQ